MIQLFTSRARVRSTCDKGGDEAITVKKFGTEEGQQWNHDHADLRHRGIRPAKILGPSQ